MPTPLRVLIVEDSEDDTALLVRELQRGYDVTYERVDTQPAMSAALDQQIWDIVIADYTLPHFSAFAALALLKARTPDTPFIIVSGTIGEQVAVATMKAGVDDYLIKGHLARLIPAMKRALGEAAERRERQRVDAALHESEERNRATVAAALDGIITIDQTGRVVAFNPAAEQIFSYCRADVLGRELAELIIPLSVRAEHRRGLAHCVATGEGSLLGTRMELTAMRADGSEFPVELTIARIPTDGPPLFTGFVRDITQRKRAEDRIQHQLGRLAALRTIDMAIITSVDLHVTLDVIFEQITGQLAIDAADVLLLNPHTQTLEYADGRGFRSSALQHTHLRLGEGYAGRAALERRTISIPNLADAEDFRQQAPLLAGEGFIAYFGVPLLAKGQIKGVLEIFHRAPLAPEPEWLDFLEALAGQTAIAIDNAVLFDDLQRSNIALTLAYDTTLEGWSRALDLRDKETEGHSQRVTEVTLRLARAIGMSLAELGHVRRGALLHDIGKMGIPDAILLKPGPLTDDEWQIMRKHPVYAYELLAPIAFLKEALEIPYCHHEKWDATGYPRGLQGEQIPFAARIFAVADVWDAMRSDRPYRKGARAEVVREHIRSLAGTHFDPQVVRVFLELEL